MPEEEQDPQEEVDRAEKSGNPDVSFEAKFEKMLDETTPADKLVKLLESRHMHSLVERFGHLTANVEQMTRTGEDGTVSQVHNRKRAQPKCTW
eukprot:7361812-Pyramimonas_sp.AAC.1